MLLLLLLMRMIAAIGAGDRNTGVVEYFWLVGQQLKAIVVIGVGVVVFAV